MKSSGGAIMFVAVQVLLCIVIAVPQVCRAAEINAWDIITVESGARPNETGSSLYSSIALDKEGPEHMAFAMIYEGDFTLKYAGFTEKGMVVDNVDDLYPFSTPSIAVDETGIPHVAYVATGSRLMYSVRGETGWNKTAVTQAGRVMYAVSLALDESGHPHIACLNDTSSTYDLRYLAWNGSAWRSEYVDNSTLQDGYPSLALDSSGNPRISYFDMVNKHLKFARRTGTGWGTSIVDPVGGLGSDTSLAVDKDDVPHIAYHNYSARELRYAVWNLTHWTTAVVDAVDSASSDASIALDTDGRPSIAYLGRYYGLKYARLNGGTWQSEAVDSEYGSGLGPSIKIDMAGYPHISYIAFDGTFASSKLARGHLDEPPEWISLSGQTYPTANEEECYVLGGSDPEDDPFTFTIDWGDGSVDVTDPAKNGEYVVACHIWLKGGQYVITVTGKDLHGLPATDSRRLDVSVYDPASKPVYELAWFWLIVALVAVVLLAVVLEYRRKRRPDDDFDKKRPPDAKQE